MGCINGSYPEVRLQKMLSFVLVSASSAMPCQTMSLAGLPPSCRCRRAYLRSPLRLFLFRMSVCPPSTCPPPSSTLWSHRVARSIVSTHSPFSPPVDVDVENQPSDLRAVCTCAARAQELDVLHVVPIVPLVPLPTLLPYPIAVLQGRERPAGKVTSQYLDLYELHILDTGWE